MKVATTVLFVLLLASPILAQETAPSAPDYSKDTLLRLFAEGEERPERERNVKWSFGRVEFKALGMRWRIGYLPFLVPLPGSYMDTTGWGLPDPFLLTGTEIATTPRTFRDRRAMSAEMKRIDRLTKRATVKVEP
jgi:hypothetical protein